MNCAQIGQTHLYKYNVDKYIINNLVKLDKTKKDSASIMLKSKHSYFIVFNKNFSFSVLLNAKGKFSFKYEGKYIEFSKEEAKKILHKIGFKFRYIK